jgi:HD-like signal output (HDOD) protein
MREVTKVVNLSLSRKIFARDLPGYGVTANDYWSDSIASALVMEALAKHCGLNQEDAYTIGILHAIGRVLINRVIDDQGFSVYWDGKQPIQDWERNAVGFEYADAGAMLLEHWNFPPATCDVIRWQLSPEKIVQQVSFLGALQFTLRLLALTGLDFENKDWQLPEADPFVRASGLTPELISKFVSTCHDDFKAILQSVELN